MTVVWVVVVVLVAAALALLAAGLVEVYVQLGQVRTVLRLQDEPTPVHLTTLGSTIGELVPDPPAGVRRAAEAPTGYVLVLSSNCAICQVIGSGLAAGPERFAGGLAVLVAAESEQSGGDFLRRTELPPALATVDVLGRTAKRLGIEASPTVVNLRDGRLRAAATLASFRQLDLFWRREEAELAASRAG